MTSPKLTQALRKMLPDIGSKIICDAVCERYPHVFDGSDTLPIPYAEGTHGVSIPPGELEVGIGSLNLNIPTTSETAVPEPVGTSPNQDKPTVTPTDTPKAEPAQRPDRPAQCPPEDWTKYLRFSRGFHTDKANQLGARAPFTDAKVLDGAKALDTLIRVRGRPEDEVLAVLGWSIEDPFWSTNLRSIKALLKTSSSNGELKYSNVLTAMTRDLEHRAERSMAANG